MPLVRDGGFDTILDFAAASHVDRLIHDAMPSSRANVVGTQCLLDSAREAEIPRYAQICTDDDYGTPPPDEPPYRVTTPLAPNRPYAAGKEAGEESIQNHKVKIQNECKPRLSRMLRSLNIELWNVLSDFFPKLKAGADLLVRAAHRTIEFVDTIITRYFEQLRGK